MREIKYFLIISQYRHSYHTFIAKVIEDIPTFKSALLGLVEELENYKRESDDNREKRYGDLEYLLDDSKEIMYRYNVNDSGDIYIINHESINRLKEEASYYELQGYKDSRRYISKKIIEDVSKHHNHQKIREIIEKYFEIA